MAAFAAFLENPVRQDALMFAVYADALSVGAAVVVLIDAVERFPAKAPGRPWWQYLANGAFSISIFLFIVFVLGNL